MVSELSLLLMIIKMIMFMAFYPILAASLFSWVNTDFDTLVFSWFIDTSLKTVYKKTVVHPLDENFLEILSLTALDQ